jgi:hypothetical protein
MVVEGEVFVQAERWLVVERRKEKVIIDSFGVG